MTIELEPEVVEQLKQGRKINAIKKLREYRGIGLKEAKELVDVYCDENKITRPTNTVERSRYNNALVSLIAFSLLVFVLFQIFVK